MFSFKITLKQILFFVLSVLVIVILFTNCNDVIPNSKFTMTLNVIQEHQDMVRIFASRRKVWKTSNLGTYIFKNFTTEYLKEQSNKTVFVILIWKHWDWLQNRHLYNFKNRKQDPFESCSVKNCILTGDNKYFKTADAVVVHLQRGVIPKRIGHSQKQIWIFLSDESASHTYNSKESARDISDLENIFNWSMTFRSDSDVPVPYGRTVPLSMPLLHDVSHKSLAKLVPYWNIKRRDKLATVLMSHCNMPPRTGYLEELEKYLSFDMYGRCSKNNKYTCPGHYKVDCPVLSKYLFYFAFENSQCREYLSEKLFYNAIKNGAIPVIMGAPISDCETILPPNSFLHVDNFKTPQHLADFIIYLSKNDERLLAFHKWRNYFNVINEHGYFGTKSIHFCRVCEALNYNDRSEKIYNETQLRKFLDEKVTCTK